MSTLLHYHRCSDCLTAFSTVERHVDFCDCNGSVEYMGEVHGDKYQKTGTKSACDDRCTKASGPNCDCMCNGINHGTGKLVSVIVSEGKVKAVGLTPEDIERAEKYRMLRDYAQSLMATKQSHMIYYAKRELNHIIDMKKYDLRMQKLVTFIAEQSKED